MTSNFLPISDEQLVPMAATDIKAANKPSFLFPREHNAVHGTRAVVTEVSQDWKLIAPRHQSTMKVSKG